MTAKRHITFAVLGSVLLVAAFITLVSPVYIGAQIRVLAQGPTTPEATLSSADQPVPPLKPGDRIGDTILSNDKPDFNVVPTVWRFCQLLPATDAKNKTWQPYISVQNCTVPLVPALIIGPGTTHPTAALRDLSWKSLSWMLEFDGRAIDLPSFSVLDVERPNGFARGYITTVKNLTPGSHTLHVAFLLTQALVKQLPDGPYTIEGGAYDYTFNITVQASTATAVPTTAARATTDASALAGKYGLPPGYLIIDRNGTYSVVDQDGTEMVTGRYKLTGDQIALTDDVAGLCPSGVTGIYHWMLKGNTLTLTVIDDKCTRRNRALRSPLFKQG